MALTVVRVAPLLLVTNAKVTAWPAAGLPLALRTSAAMTLSEPAFSEVGAAVTFIRTPPPPPPPAAVLVITIAPVEPAMLAWIVSWRLVAGVLVPAV